MEIYKCSFHVHLPEQDIAFITLLSFKVDDVDILIQHDIVCQNRIFDNKDISNMWSLITYVDRHRVHIPGSYTIMCQMLCCR